MTIPIIITLTYLCIVMLTNLMINSGIKIYHVHQMYGQFRNKDYILTILYYFIYNVFTVDEFVIYYRVDVITTIFNNICFSQVQRIQ